MHCYGSSQGFRLNGCSFIHWENKLLLSGANWIAYGWILYLFMLWNNACKIEIASDWIISRVYRINALEEDLSPCSGLPGSKFHKKCFLRYPSSFASWDVISFAFWISCVGFSKSPSQAMMMMKTEEKSTTKTPRVSLHSIPMLHKLQSHSSKPNLQLQDKERTSYYTG